MKVTNKITRWVFKDIYKLVEEDKALIGKAREIVAQYDAMLQARSLNGKLIKIDGDAVILGDLLHCQIETRPQVHTKVVLSETKLGSLLACHAPHTLIHDSSFNNTFNNAEEAIHVEIPER